MKNPLDRASRFFGIGAGASRSRSGPSRSERGSSARNPSARSARRAEAATGSGVTAAARESGVPETAEDSVVEPVGTEPVEGPGRTRTVSSRLGMDTDPVTEAEPARLGEEEWDEEGPQPVAARSFSGRTLLLLIIVVALVVPLAGPVHTYFSQQAEVAALNQDISRLQGEQQDLKDQESRWNSDDYVREQARERLFYVQPGDVPYVVTGQDGASQPADSSAEAATQAQDSWGQNLWQSVAGTDH